jgi:hypothetical protein
MSRVHVEHGVRAFGGEHAIRMSNDHVELILATDYGPRVMSYALRGGDNVFGFIDPATQGSPTSLGELWHIYGGHRLWHAPEHPVHSYIPDNQRIDARVEGESTVVLTLENEALTGLTKELRVSLAPMGSRVSVEHRITNATRAGEAVELAVWGLSLMAQGGTAIFPHPPYVAHPEGLLPSQRVVLWPYTWLGDPRFRFGPRYIRLRQDPSATGPQKIGLYDEHHGWTAYALGDRLFVKRAPVATPSTVLADLGCNIEAFTNAAFLELETLGPMVRLAPGESASHLETWHLFAPVVVPENDEDAQRVLEPMVANTR